jgi:RNA polymerase sigma-70 factor (ECF subfamily)
MTTRAELETLIARMAQGDREALGRLYATTGAKLFGIACRVLDDRAEAEEALQDIYIRVWHSAGRYRANGLSPMTWLVTVARNLCIDRLRARRGGSAPLDEAAELADLSPGPEAQGIAARDRARLIDCLATLPPDRAEAVMRAYMHGDSYADLAVRFGIPLNTVRTWLRRSLLKLRECLSP